MSDSPNSALTPALSRSSRRGGSILAAGSVLAWAVYLGASWTWCIGMFLPVLLIRDYGIWGFVVFAVPNVVGAAAMAWVLPNAEASRAFVARHRVACSCFSAATLFFHGYFLGWIVQAALNNFSPLINLSVLLVPLAFLVIAYSRRGRHALALISFSISTLLAWLLWHTSVIPRPAAPPQAGADLMGIAAVCGFGLLLCPYLDLTFHEARQGTTAAGGRAAFGIGFAVFFFSMILFTFAYSGWLMPPRKELPQFLITALSIHFLVQSALKFALHTHQIGFSWLKSLIVIGVLLALWLGGRAGAQPEIWPANIHADWIRNSWYFSALQNGEFGYRCFMSLYGLFFPAYVWICIFRRRDLKRWLTYVLIAAPMYWMGFIEGCTIYLLPAVGILLLAGIWPREAKLAAATV